MPNASECRCESDHAFQCRSSLFKDLEFLLQDRVILALYPSIVSSKYELSLGCLVSFTLTADSRLLCVLHVYNVCTFPSAPLDNILVMVIFWRLRGNIIRTALCWIVWHNVHSLQHTYVSSCYRSNRLGLSHWNPYTVRRGGCLELYYCNMVEWFWCDSSLIFDDQLVSFSALTLLVWSSGL